MADYGFNTQLTPQTQQSSLGDMLNLARGIQSYQQAQQINPLTVQQQQAATQKGLLELKQLEIAAKERDAVMPYLQDPKNYTNEDGLIDMNKATADIYHIAPNNPGVWLKPLQDLATGQLNLAQSKLTLDNAQRSKVGQAIAAVARSADRDNPLAYSKAFENLTAVDKSLTKLVQNYNNMLGKFQAGGHIGDDMLREAQSMLTLPEQESIFGTKVSQLDLGPSVQPYTLRTPVGSMQPQFETLGAPIKKAAAPFASVVTTPTGAPSILEFKGGATGETKAKEPAPASDKVIKDFEKSGGLQISPGETYEAYRARVGRLAALPDFATKSMSLANPESVPNTQKINNNILNLLDDKDVNVGKVADYVAGKTAGISLNSKEQVIQKYLEQRVRQVAARSNQDQASVKQALGSFGNDKDALRTIIYNDAGTLAAESLYNQGVLRARGDANKPNLAAVADFEQKFSNLVQDPDVMHLIGLVGNKTKLSQADQNHFRQYFKGKDLQALFAQKDKIENLVRGGQ